jgi:hypothetical protein
MSERLPRISHFMIPSGGWVFKEGDDFFIRASTWKDLVTDVMNHRKANGKPCGSFVETEVEIEDQIAEDQPQIIINGPKSKKNPWA